MAAKKELEESFVCVFLVFSILFCKRQFMAQLVTGAGKQGFSLVRNSAVADRTDRGLSVEDGRYHRLLIENVYNVEFAIVLVSELQTNIFAHPSSNRKYCWEGIKNATFITYQQGRIKIRKCHTKTSTAKLCELLRQIIKAINCMHSLQAYGTATGLAWCIG